MIIKAGEKYNLKGNSAGYENSLPCTFVFELNGDALTFNFKVTDNQIFSPYEQENDDLYQADAVEVFISPDGNLSEYYELEVSPRGVKFFAKIHNEMDGNATIEGERIAANFIAQSEITKSGYNVKILLPTILLNGFNKDKFMLNAYRLDYSKAADADSAQIVGMQALNPTGRNKFHFSEYFIKPEIN